MALPTKSNTSRPLAAGYGALIEYGSADTDSLYLPLAVSPDRAMTFQTVEPRSKAPDVSQHPEDMRPESGETFSLADFSGGEGLRFAHRRTNTDIDSTRFFASLGVDASPSESGQPEPITLLKASASLRTGVTTSVQQLSHALATNGEQLFGVISAANRVDVSDNPTAGTPSWSVENPHDSEGNQNVLDVVVLNHVAYANITTNGIHVRNVAAAGSGTWSHWSDLTPAKIWAAKGRILAADGAFTQLYEAASGAGSTLVGTHERIHDIVDAGTVVLVSSTDGWVYAYSEEEGSLALVGQTKMPGSETPYAMGAALGVVLINTLETAGSTNVYRIYRGVVVGTQVRNLQLLRTWTGVDSGPYEMVTSRNAIWFAVGEGSNNFYVWRYDLATGGLYRHTLFDLDSSSAEGIAVVNSRLFLKENDDDLYREATTFVDSGYVISPLVDFYTAAQKTWMGLRIEVGDVPTGTMVQLYYSTDPAALDNPAHSSWTLVVTIDDDNDPPEAEIPILGSESRWAAMKAVLTANTANTSAPEVLAVAIRGVPTPTEEDYLVPVNISDRLEIPGRKAITVAGVGDTRYDALKGLEGRSVTVTLLRSGEKVKGQIRQVSTPIEGTPRKGSQTVFCNMVVRGQRQTS